MVKLLLLASFIPGVRVGLEGKPALCTVWQWVAVLGEQGVCSAATGFTVYCVW